MRPRITAAGVAVAVASVAIASLAVAQLTNPPHAVRTKVPDVPYVPTPPKVVDAMLELAKVQKDDVVYDLGCGDGRIVIEAAKRFGARGVGIDINPALIQEARRKAAAAEVTDRVQFLEQDLFEADFREATVVTLYLLSAVNLRLRPRLLDQLRPGTRIVSHAFDMGEWTPDRTVNINGSKAFLWVVPEHVPAELMSTGAGARTP